MVRWGADRNNASDFRRLYAAEPLHAGLVILGDKNKITVAGVACDVPVFPAGLAGMGDMLGIMAGLPGDGNQVDAEAFVDQKPHDTVTVSSLRRA
jgi:hypothetical protein